MAQHRAIEEEFNSNRKQPKERRKRFCPFGVKFELNFLATPQGRANFLPEQFLFHFVGVSADDRPRERLIKFRADKLSDAEILAILLRLGFKGQSAVDMARELVKKFGSFRNINIKSLAELKKIRGLGIPKIGQKKAAIEIGKRLLKEKNLSKIKLEEAKI